MQMKSEVILEKPVKWIWRKLYWACHGWQRYFALNPVERHIRREMQRNYDHLPINNNTKQITANIRNYAEQLYGEEWNYYSDALLSENIFVFQEVVSGLESEANNRVSYLEIGSARGLSMSLVGSLLSVTFGKIRLVSLDPYYDCGYREGRRGIFGIEHHVNINKETRDLAFSLYDLAGLAVELVQAPSNEGLVFRQ